VKRRTLYFIAPEQVKICQEDLPALQPDHVLVQTSLSAVSAGTELLFYRGQFPPHLPLDENLPALNQPSAYPMKYGYSSVGVVIAAGSAIDQGWLNKQVFAFNPHEDYFCARPADLILIPESISKEDAIFLPNMETAINLVMDGAPLIGENVVIFGQGVIGLLTTALLGCFPLGKLITFDHIALRRLTSLELGARASFDPQDFELGKAQLPAGADLAYELSGAPPALDQAIALTGFGGRVLIGSWYGRKKVNLDLGGGFHRSRIRLVSSQVSTLAPELSARWTKERRFDVAWEMIKAIHPSRLITHSMPIDQAEAAYAMLDKEPGQSIQVVFTYEHPSNGEG
jgi:2-desacetyl-2-hydroxyethyl bacteriochlorophyllide A dehydrogenase